MRERGELPMEQNLKLIMAIAIFWAIGTYFLTAGHLNAGVVIDDPFDDDRQVKRL
jgi:hypothetical protein